MAGRPDPNRVGFTITSGKGFWMTFQNGYTVSVQWGFSNYCANRELFIDDDSAEHPPQSSEYGGWFSKDAEVMVTDLADENVTHKFFGGDEHMTGCYVKPDVVAEIIKWTQEQ